MTTGPRGQHSPDGAHWWTGAGWVTAWSPDRRWWFDGTKWVRPSRPRLLSRNDFVIPGIWGLGVVAAIALAIDLAHRRQSTSGPRGEFWALWAVGALALIGTPITGFVAGRRPRAVERLLLCAGYIWFGFAATYTAAMLAQPVLPTDTNDTAAGAGLAILGIPAGVAIAVLLGLGALARWRPRRPA